MEPDSICRIRRLSKRYGTTEALRDVDLELRRNELVSIIGPSGAGKTTLLRLIAGLEDADGGELRFSVPPSRENPVVLVFQDFMLFPSMTVARNVGFGLRARGVKGRETKERVAHLLEVFGISDKADSFPNLLSAGQQQRVALARALAIRPRMLLLDEPFGHLDKTLKMDTALYVRRIQREFGITTVAVTHDLEEAFAMSDRVGIMIDGRLVQTGPVEEVYTRPASLEAARFLGPVNRFPAALLAGMERDHSAAGVLVDGNEPTDPGEPLYCRAESMSITPEPKGPGVVTDVTFIGIMVLYRVHMEHSGTSADLAVLSLENGIKPGTRVRIRISRVLKEEQSR